MSDKIENIMLMFESGKLTQDESDILIKTIKAKKTDEEKRSLQNKRMREYYQKNKELIKMKNLAKYHMKK